MEQDIKPQMETKEPEIVQGAISPYVYPGLIR